MHIVLGGLDKFDFESICAWAMAQGVKLVSNSKMTQHQVNEVSRRRNAGEPMHEIARRYNGGHITISTL